MASVFDMYYDLEEAAGSPDPMVQRYIPIAAGTCLELFYRQVGRYRFNPKMYQHTPFDLRVTAADIPEVARTMARLDPADLFWADRAVQSVDDMRSIQSELHMESVFKGDPQLLDATHYLYHIRNEMVHGAGTRRYDPRLVLRTVRRHIEKSLAQMQPLPAVFLLRGGARAEMRGDGDAAASLYRRAMEEADRLDADPSARHVIAGKALEGLGSGGEAFGRYERAVAANPRSASAHAAAGRMLAHGGSHAEALAAYGRAVEINPGYARAHIGMGNVLRRLDRGQEALDSYGRAAEADPASAEAHMAAGALHESKGREQEALDSYGRAAEADPASAEAHMAAGALHESKGREQEALDSYGRAAEADPKSARAHIAAGKVHESKGREQEALYSYRRAAEADPKSARAHIAAGKVHESKGREQEALYSYRRAAEADPSYAKAHVAAGMLNEAIGNTPESKSGYSAAAGLSGATEPAGGALAWALKRQGRPSEVDDIIRDIRSSRRRDHDDRRE